MRSGGVTEVEHLRRQLAPVTQRRATNASRSYQSNVVGFPEFRCDRVPYPLKHSPEEQRKHP